MEKYEYWTGEDLGLEPSTVEQTKCEYSPLGKVFTKGLDEDDKKEWLFKRLKNIEGKIKGENKKESEPIENEEQLEAIKDESSMSGKKPKEIVLLEDKLDYIFTNFGSRFNSTGKNFLKRLAKDEKEIDHNNSFLKQMISLFVKSVDFLEEIGILYNFLIYLLDNSKLLLISTKTQLDLAKAIIVLEIIITNMKNDITDQTEEQKRKLLQNKKVF